MKVRVPPIGIEIEGIIHRGYESDYGSSSSEDLKDYVASKFGEFINFEGGSAHSGSYIFEMKTNPSTQVCAAVSELSGHLRELHNAMSAYHRAHDAEDDLERGQRLMFAGSKPMVGESSGSLGDILNRPVFGDTRSHASGLHIHAGVPFEEHAAVVEKLEPYAPLFTALTASSPFDHNGNPDWVSYRMIERINRTSYQEPVEPYFYRYGGGTSRDLDLGFEPDYNRGKSLRPETIECVVMDSTSSLEDIACVTALYQGLVCKAMHEAEMDCLLEGAEKIDLEQTGNMSRVCKDGLDAELLCTDGSTVLARDAVRDMINELSPYLKALETEEIALHAETIMREGTSADRQVKLFNDQNRQFEVDGRREELLEVLSQRVFDKPFSELDEDEHKKMFEDHARYEGSKAIYPRQKTKVIADVVERSIVRESLDMARAGRGKQTKKEAYAMSESGIDHLEVEDALKAQGEVLEIEVDLSQQNDEPEKEQDTFARA